MVLILLQLCCAFFGCVVWIKSLATVARYSFCSGSRSCGMNFTRTGFMWRSCVTISDTVDFGIPRSASSFHTVSHPSLLIAACTRSTFSGVLPIIGLPEHGSLSPDFQPSLKHLYHTFICTALIALSLKAFWIIRIVSAEKCSSLMCNLMQIHCYSCSVILNAMATSTHAHSTMSTAPPLTGTVKLSLSMHAHSSPLSLAASLRAITQSILIILTMTGLLPDDFILSLIHYFITHLYYNYKPTFEYPCIYIHGN